jgi:MFS family permease
MENAHADGRAAAGAPARPAYKWIALSNTTIGVLMASMNSSVVLIALPAIFNGIRMNPLQPGNSAYFLWLLMGYMLVTAVLVVSFGRLGDIYGRVRMYNLGFATFTLFSVLLAVTWTTGPAAAVWLIAMRILQGVGGAFLMANSSAILTDAFPETERGLALGINSVAGIAGSFVGLVVGGLLGPLDWRLVFLVSVPFGLFGTLWAYLKLRDTGVRRAARIDWWGNLAFAAGLVLVLVGITYGIEPAGRAAMGWGSPRVLGALIGGGVILAVFTALELRAPDPMFRLRLFRIRAFSAGNLASLLASLGRGGLMFLLIIWLQGIWLPRHGFAYAQTPLWAGIYMLPLTLGFLVAGPLSGILSDRFGARPFATGGMVAAALSFLLLDRLPVDFAYPAFAALLLLNGLAMGLFSAPNRAGIMNSLPPDQRGAGAGMVATFQNVGMVLSIGIYFTLVVAGLSRRLPAALLSGLAAHGVPATVAAGVAHLPPVGVLFAAFLGYNPMQSLLGGKGVLAALPPADRAAVLGRRFFPQVIAGPFAHGLHAAFVFSLLACLVAAGASWLRGGIYHYREPEAPPVPAPARGNEEERLAEMTARAAAWRRQALAEPRALVVAVSASYGAGGALIAPRLADRLGLPFLDRAVPPGVAAALAGPLAEALSRGDDGPGPAGILALMAQAPTLFGSQWLSSPDPGEEELRAATEMVLWQLCAEGGAVILGRAAALLLAPYPRAFRVRLDGPPEARLRRAVEAGGLDVATARRQQRETDGARAAYARHLYGVDMSDPRLYHLVVDATAFDVEDCVDLIAGWAQRWAGAPAPPAGARGT